MKINKAKSLQFCSEVINLGGGRNFFPTLAYLLMRMVVRIDMIVKLLVLVILLVT